ncbi:MAG TPA: hypothetical protein VHV57_00780 [Acidimicrobiales bacterium]|jgi:hypothetical protein|nr:hypothetical protein [Acidimicrobiales bacterium]
MSAGERPVDLVDLQGAWRRNGRTFSEGPWEEVSDVLWLQVGLHFCDLRTPHPSTQPSSVLDQAQAFSGVVQVHEGAISFHHDLDSLPRDPAHPDQGTVHRREDVMIERGPGFEERWIVASLPGDEAQVAEYPGESGPLARVIRIGTLALAVWGGPTSGGAQFNKRHDWLPERPLGQCPGHIDLHAAAAAMGTGETLPAGWVAIDPVEV